MPNLVEKRALKRHVKSGLSASSPPRRGKNGWLYLSVIKTATKNKQTRGREDEPSARAHTFSGLFRGTAVTSPGAQINDLARLSIQISVATLFALANL